MYAPIPVNLPQNPYQIAIAPDSLSQLGQYLSNLKLGKKVLLISNPEIFNYYGEVAYNSLEAAGFEIGSHLIPAGEVYKTLDSISKIYDAALEQRLERASTLVALGGGVIGDMVGFAAATWLRGVNFVQVPTSLLAMVDASIGGKTGVNHPKGKNLIGAFYQPRLVLIDPQVLQTLPAREFRAGMAEVIKYGIVWDADLFSQLEATERLDELGALEEELLLAILSRCCQAKVDVVTKDEREAGVRAILNYGHTIGHAIESLTGYGTLNHGEAVAIGMAAAGKIATRLHLWSATETERQDCLIAKANLPNKIPANLKAGDIIEALQADKKVKAGKIRFVLPEQIGKVKITDQVPTEIIRDVLESLKSC